MPTPVAAARQCLTEEAARALDDAVAVARRRSHAQTTSLHALSALLALPSSALRSTCSRLAAAGSRPPRLQLKALELSVGVSLDRLPTSRSGAGEEDGGGPPLSNSLMAAIRRSQANQRRQPESFYTYSNTASVLKVELKHFIVSILDDPIISRVFWEAGFRSCDIKLALLNPPISPRRRGPIRPPMFLCNFPGYDVDRFRLGKEDGDESFRRIVNVLLGKDGKGRNPLLVGASSHDVVDRFVSVVSGSGGNREVLLGELVGVGVASLGEVVGDKERMRLKFEEICSELERGTWMGLIVNYGELKGLVAEEDDDGAGNCLVSGLRGLVERYKGKVWLIGAATSNEAVSHLVKRFPDIERDLDLHVLPVASSSNRFVYSPTSQSSLMRSFVPFGGFFPTPDDLRNPFSISPQIARCHLCTANFEQEVDAMTKAGMKVPVADRQAQNLPSWLQMADGEASGSKDLTQTVDEGTMNAEILGLERKWTDTCRRLHHPQQFSMSDVFSVGSPVNVTQDVGFSLEKVKPGWIMDSLPNDHQCKELTPGVVIDSTQPKHIRPVQLVSRGVDTSCQANALQDTANSQTKGDSTLQDSPIGCRVPSSITSGARKAASELLYASSSLEPDFLKKCDAHHNRHISPSNSVTSDACGERASRQIREPACCSGLSSADQFDSGLPKTIRRVLAEKVCWQDEAICQISEALSCSRTKRRHNATGTRGDIWLSFLGPDRVGKRRIASALAEIIVGSSKPFVYVDLSSHDRDSPSNLIFGCQESSDYDLEFVGRTHVDRIAAEVRKNPRSVVFLENMDKADLLVQSSLSQAIRSGKLPDSCGREISIENVLFVMTTPSSVHKQHPSADPIGTRYSEEEVLAAGRWQMNLSVDLLVDGANLHDNMKVRVIGNVRSCKPSSNKRERDGYMKVMRADARKRSQPAHPTYFDLNNPPAEEMEEDTSSGDSYCDLIAKDTEAWLENFLDQVDEKVTFKPFDFDALEEKTTKRISTRFVDVFGSTGRLDITHQAMVQMLAASWSSESDRSAEEWVDKVLTRGFTEAQYKYPHHLRGRVLVTLAACEGHVMEQQADGICLPSTINLLTK